MTIDQLILSIRLHAQRYPSEADSAEQIIHWIEQYGEFAFVKSNLEGHITGTIMVLNPDKTKLLLMLHKKLQIWTGFGGHSDGEVDIRKVAIREFHEESGIQLEPVVAPQIFQIEVHDIPLDKKGTPQHKHFDILFLGIIPVDMAFSRQESEVDDIRWFSLDEALLVNNERLMRNCIAKIRNIPN